MNPNMMRVFIAGFVSTIIITLMMNLVSPFMSGGLVGTAALLNSLLGTTWRVAIAAHVVIGALVLPAAYGLFVYRTLTGSPAVRGMTWGLVLWILSQAIVVPILGGGFFSSHAGDVMSVMDSLIGHLVYGLVLGVGSGAAHESLSAGIGDLGSEARIRRAG
jgi:uncharacterized protein DUF6789